MRNYLLPLLVAFLTISTVFSQNDASYYLKVLDTAKNKQLRLNALDSLTWNNKTPKDLEAFTNRVEEYVTLAIELEKYEKAIEMAIRSFYNINIRHGQPDRALAIMETAEKVKDKTTDSYLLGGIYLKKGGGYFSRDYNKAIENYTKAIAYYAEKDSIYKADAIFFRGQAFFDAGDYLKSINDYKLASEYYEKLGDLEYTFYTRGSLISVYGVIGFDEKTIEERFKLIEKKTSKGYFKGLTVDYYNLSKNYKDIGNREQEIKYLFESLKYIETDKTLNNKHQIYGAIANHYLDKNDLVKAEEYIDKVKELATEFNQSNRHLHHYNKIRSYYLFKKKRYPEALVLAKKYLASSEFLKRPTFIIGANELLHKIYDATGNSKKALHHFKTYTKIKDSVFNLKKVNALSYYQTLYEAEQNEKEITNQKNAIKILNQENTAKNRLIIFGSICIAALALIFYLFWNRRNLKEQKRLKENYAQKLLLYQEEERKRISKDLHDSLGQSLLVIKNTATKNKDEETANLVNNAIEEMREIARVLHPSQLENIGITNAIENLITRVDASYPKTLIFGDIDNIDEVLTQEQEVNIFRIIQECLTNIIKHASADSAKVNIKKSKTNIQISVKDNGVGFDFLDKYKNTKSLGLKTIKDRIKLLEGSFKVDSKLEQGTTFTILLPV